MGPLSLVTPESLFHFSSMHSHQLTGHPYLPSSRSTIIHRNGVHHSRVLFSRTVITKYHRIRGLPTEMYFLMVLEAGSLR